MHRKSEKVWSWILVLPPGFDSSCFIQGPPICYQPSTLNNTPKMPSYCHWQSEVLLHTYREGARNLQMIFFIFDEWVVALILYASSNKCVCIQSDCKSIGPERHIQVDGTSPKNYTSGLSFNCHILSDK